MGRAAHRNAAGARADQGGNPLDASTGIPRATTEQLKAQQRGLVVDFDSSAYNHLSLQTISALAREAASRPDALKFFPPGSKLRVSAEEERGDFTEDGWLRAYVELIYPNGSGGWRTSGQDTFYSSGGNSGIISEFSDYLRRLEGIESKAD